MKTFKEKIILDENRLNHLFSLRDEVATGGDVAFHTISEASLSRLLQKASETDWAIVTAYRKGFTKQQNVARNRDLRGELNRWKLGSYGLVGYWQECTVTDEKGDPLDWRKCPKDKLETQVERSYFVPRNVNVPPKTFHTIITQLGAKFKQDAVVLWIDELDLRGVYDPRTGVQYVNFGKRTPNLNQVAQAYSRFVKKQNIPFTFEGIEIPNGTVYGLKGFYDDGFRWNV